MGPIRGQAAHRRTERDRQTAISPEACHPQGRGRGAKGTHWEVHSPPPQRAVVGAEERHSPAQRTEWQRPLRPATPPALTAEALREAVRKDRRNWARQPARERGRGGGVPPAEVHTAPYP